MYRNLEGKRFEDVTERVGGPLLDLRPGRGAAFGDIDNDGDIDVVVSNVNDTLDLYRLESRNRNHWITLALRGAGNRLAVGARVRVTAGGASRIDEVRSGGSYYSQNDLRLHFGLGSTVRVDALEIRWPDGKTETLRDLTADRVVRIDEGKGITP